MDFSEVLHYAFVALLIFGLVTIRSFVIGVPFYLYFYHFNRHQLNHRKFNPNFPDKETIQQEFKLTILAGFSFVIWDLLAYISYRKGFTLIYTDLSDYSLFYTIISFPILMLLHDTYFYWTHRYMHSKEGRWIKHSTHHAFKNPTPWSSFSISFQEGLVQMFFHFLIVHILPLHPIVIALYLVGTFITNLMGHSGYRFSKKRSVIFSDSECHYLHHRHNKYFYGLYFRFWDQWLKTETKPLEKVN